MELKNKDKITGYIEHIVFRNEENGYTVFEISNNGEQSSCVGCFHYINEGEYIEATGEYVEHPIYGLQFKVDNYEVKIPTDVKTLERYLGSGAIKGIGPALASRIVNEFMEDTLYILENEPEQLVKVKGISAKKAREIGTIYNEKKDLRQAMIFLQEYGISVNLAARIYEHYNDDIYRIIKENPYRMAEEVNGIGFRIADEIASKVGIKTNSDYRIRSGILYVLTLALNDGHTYLPHEVLANKCVELLGVDTEFVEKVLMDLSMDKKIIIDVKDNERRYYASKYYYLEMGIASKLRMLAVTYGIDENQINNRIKNVEKNNGIELDDKQRKAVVETFRNGVLVITGGPGTGKTTTINAMIKCFEEGSKTICLAAPTGRAAKRMTEASGYEAKTIHRLLEVSGSMENSNEYSMFGRNEENPIEADLVIVDEVSMVDVNLMMALLKAIVPPTRLVLVGDANQLPSVGPGSVLKDIINSNIYPVVKLDKIFRQAKTSDIVVNSHKINNGEMISLDNKSKDFFFLKRYNADIIISVLLTLIQKKLPSYINEKPFDIQVLTPMRKGLLGVERLNTILQKYLNPPAPDKNEKEIGSRIFREGDKVMQIKNNYQLEWNIMGNYNIVIDSGVGVFNGDLGIVKEINSFAETMTVVFDENKEVEYSFKMLEELELAYAITIHKSQGSEYPAVLLPILSGPQMLFNRNLLYTAVTRAKKCVTIVGDEKVFYDMINNENEKIRYSGLKDRIIEEAKEAGI